jgi:hypothetical protein
VSTSGSKFSVGLTNLNLSGNEVECNLINPDEIMRLPPTELLVFSHGMPPYRGKKIIYYLDSRFRRFANLPAPQGRDELILELPPVSTSRAAWSDLQDQASAELEENRETGIIRKKSKHSSGGSQNELEMRQGTIANPEEYFSQDPFEGGAPDSDKDPELVDSPFGSIRRSEL